MCFLYYINDLFWFIGVGDSMNKRQEEIQDEIVNRVYKIFDKLEQRIATLEKVLQSHAKCIGEMREEKNE